jgi:hypothetical protein
MPLPDPVLWKVFRSKTHAMELQTEIQRYFNTNPAKIVRDEGGNSDEFIGTIKPGGAIPGRLPIIIGDCLQNLRSALDYMVWELVLAAKNKPGRHNMFPICSTLKAFEDQLNKKNRLKGINPDAIAEIQSLQPYHSGQDFDKAMLWVLDDLCNINKHRRVLLTNLQGGPSDLELRHIDGEVFGRVNTASIKKGAKIGPHPIINGSKGRGIKLDVNPNIAVYMAFDEGVTQNLDIGLVLVKMLRYIEFVVLPRFEPFFR